MRTRAILGFRRSPHAVVWVGEWRSTIESTTQDDQPIHPVAPLDSWFDPFSSHFASDPYRSYARLRERGPFSYYEKHDTWLVPGHREVTRILADESMVRVLGASSSAEHPRRRERDNQDDMPLHARFVQFSMLDSERAVHDRLRRLVTPWFTPRAVDGLRDSVRRFVDARLEALAVRAQIDFIADFANELPAEVIGRMMGVPRGDAERLRQWSEEIVQYFDIDRSREKKTRAERATCEFYEYLLRRAQEARKRSKKGGLLADLVRLQDEGILTEDEFISTCMLLLMAGHGSTLDALGSGLHLLLRFPDEQQRLREDPNLLPSAVQEIFRYESPLPFFHRYASCEVAVDGLSFPAGTRFGLLYGSANRDPDAFWEPDRFDVGRRPNRHKAFGGGVHFCLGHHLARVVVEMVFSRLLTTFETIELVEEPRYRPGLVTRGPDEIRIAAIAR